MATSNDRAQELSKTSFWLALLSIRDEIEALSQVALEKYFYQQFDPLVAWAFASSRPDEFWDLQAARLEPALLWIWYQMLTRVGGKVAKTAGYTVGASGRGGGRGQQHWNPWSAEMHARATARVQATAQQVTRNTQDRIQKILDRFRDDPDPKGPSVEHIRKLSRGSASSRAWSVARTENTAAQAFSQQTVMEQFALDTSAQAMKGWVSSRDNRVRDSHVRLDGQWRLLEEAFKENLYYPGDPRAPARERINCRCCLQYRFV